MRGVEHLSIKRSNCAMDQIASSFSSLPLPSLHMKPDPQTESYPLLVLKPDPWFYYTIR